MKSSYIVNLVLLLLVLVLFGLNNKDSSEQHTVETMADTTVDDIKDIVIYRGNQSVTTFSKQGNNWQVVSPINARANTTRVELLLSLLHLPVAAKMAIDPETSLSQFGIDNSSPAIRLNDLHFEFGSIDVISKRRYIRHLQTLFLVNDRVAPLLNVSSHSFIDNQLFSPQQTISSLHIPSLDSNGLFTSDYTELNLLEGHWTSNTGDSVEQLQTLVDHWQYAQALQVIPVAKLGLNASKGKRIRIGFTNEADIKDYLMHSTNKALFIIDEEQQLAYQFIADIKQQLLFKAQ